MGREIKFRAWCKYTEKMRYVEDADGFKWWASSRNGPTHMLSDIGLMQFTGLKDKNGVEIYEGDIVRFVQAWNFGEDKHTLTTTVKFKEYGYTPFIYHFECEDGYYSNLISEVEVIGNRFENPELLEAEE